MDIITLFSIGVAAGGGVGAGWLIASAKLRAAAAQASLLRDHIDKIDADLKAARHEANLWRTQAENDGRARAVAEASASRICGLEAERDELRRELNESAAAVAGFKATLAEQEQGYREKIETVASIREQIHNSLQNITSESLRGSQASFLELANEVFDKYKTGASAELNALVLPIRDTLAAYQQNLTKLESERAQSNGALSAELRNVVDVGNSVRNETSKLVNALRASPKTRGRWGENTLRNVLELAGLNAYSDFACEHSFAQEGSLLRPDVVIRLPGDRSIVVDAKASMAAYLDALDSTDEAQREHHLSLHAQQLRSQVKLLAGKGYWASLPQTPDFVLMFVPGENFYAAAAERDPELFEFAFRQHVLIVTPAILIALARVIASNWRQEKVAENATRIHEIGRELYKRLATMGGHISGLGTSLSSSVRKYNDLIGSLESSVMPQARRFNELGVEGTGSQLALLTPIDVAPRQPRPDRDLLRAVLPYEAAPEAAC